MTPNGSNIQMPGNWEMMGYGQPEYVNVGFAWRGHFDQQPPAVPTKDNHVGSYRRDNQYPCQLGWQAGHRSLR